MFWVDYDIFIFLDDIDDVQFDGELFRYPQGVITLLFAAVFLTDGVGVPFDAKAGKEIDAFDLDTLILDQFSGQ